jgi:hypothetical protein
MSDVENTLESSVSIPEDFAEFEKWRNAGGELGEAQTTDETSAAADDEPAKTADDSESTDDQEQDQEAKPAKKKGGFQKRIDQLTHRNAELERALADRTAAKPAEAQKAAETATAAAGEPQAKDFETYEAYVKALTIFELDQRDRAREKQTKANEVAKTWQDRSAKVREVHSDFDEVMAEAAEVPVTELMRDYLIESDRGPEMAYKLAKDPAAAERIARLSPIAAARELALIEASLPKTAPKQKPRITSAPEPIRPVSRSAAGAKTPLSDLDDFGEYERRRRAGER